MILCFSRPSAGATVSRESAVAALSALSRELGVGVGGIVLVVVIMVLFVFMGASMLGFTMFLGGLFTLVSLVFVLFGVGVALLMIRRISRLREASRALRELARMVQAGLIGPEEVCGKNVATLPEL